MVVPPCEDSLGHDAGKGDHDASFEPVPSPHAMTTEPNYAIAEVERRWLTERSELGPLDGLAHREIEDRYITGTQLRLRKVTGAGGEPVLKLCKKYDKVTALSELITN